MGSAQHHGVGGRHKARGSSSLNLSHNPTAPSSADVRAPGIAAACRLLLSITVLPPGHRNTNKGNQQMFAFVIHGNSPAKVPPRFN